MNPGKRTWVYKTLKYLQMLLDIDEFKKHFAAFLYILELDEGTKKIREYIINYYGQNTQQWAYCYRAKCQINTNMHVESLHKVLKYHYLDGKKIKRLDKSLHALQKYIRDTTVERIRKLTIGKRHTTKI
ncbi:hypothetical protein NQ314_005506 [Rhamnusium bicolor]|uniref:Homing endonuclease LAGLIDADG domain-containing protein n=1 Tax=Rhamnusium bicolor TaxID=1586634 RepID=A0AAV8ZJL6_9CUCU|nr:hypothetical protein NQ314_005506 [Rhamnusium bicolor]